jgi:hypothetical protein
VKTGPAWNGFQLLQRSVQFDFVKLSLLLIAYVEKRLDNQPASQEQNKKISGIFLSSSVQQNSCETHRERDESHHTLAALLKQKSNNSKERH